MDTKKLKRLKCKAMTKSRKVIFDNDGGDVASLCQGYSNQDLINTRTKPAIDANIDTYIYTTGWGFGIGLHDSRVGSMLKTKKGHLKNNKTADFAKNEYDCLRINCEYVKSEGKEFFWGMRMNDTHDAGYGNVFMPENKFKNENPEVMLGKGLHGAVTAVDYLKKKVRDFAVDYITDVIDRYDIDGIFLDFFRHPVFFRSNSKGKPATQEEINAMTCFMQNLNKELNKRRIRDNKYYLIALRVPDSVEYSLKIGLDLRKWLKEGLADILFTTSYLKLNDWEYSAKLAHKYNVPVYPSLDESRVKSEYTRHKRNCLKGYYGRIMNVFESGCDGVFMFNNAGLRDMSNNIEQNWFERNVGNFKQGLVATVKGKEYVNTLSKTYFASFRGKGQVAGGALPHEKYINIPTLNHNAPVTIDKGEHTDIPVRISDDLNAAYNKGKSPIATANIFVCGNYKETDIALNGKCLDVKLKENEKANKDTKKNEYVLTAQLPVSSIKKGKNNFRIYSKEKIQLLDLWVDLDYTC